MNLQPVFDLLAGGPWKRVDALAAMAALATEPSLALPACYVVPDADTATPPAEGSYILDQVINSVFSVVLVARPDGARRGVAASELDQLADAAISRLFGQQLPEWDSPLHLVDCRTIGISAEMVSCVVRFRGRRRRRLVLTPV